MEGPPSALSAQWREGGRVSGENARSLMRMQTNGRSAAAPSFEHRRRRWRRTPSPLFFYSTPLSFVIRPSIKIPHSASIRRVAFSCPSLLLFQLEEGALLVLRRMDPHSATQQLPWWRAEREAYSLPLFWSSPHSARTNLLRRGREMGWVSVGASLLLVLA